MSFQIINLVFLVATINGVYSGVTIDFNGDFATVEPILYPITQPVYQFRIALVSDLEAESKVPGTQTAWYTHFKKGSLSYDPNSQEVSVKWDSGEENGDEYYTNHSNTIGRGFELSDLTSFNGRLIAVDDQTGLLYVFEQGKFKSWKIVECKEDPESDEKVCNTMVETSDEKISVMQIEWATVRGQHLYVGPNGHEGSIFAAEISKDGTIRYLNWKDEFKGLRRSAEMEDGYLVQESCAYSSVHKKFFLLPKKGSQSPYNSEDDKTNSIHVLLPLAGEDVENLTAESPIKIQHQNHPDRGYSSFRFVPNSDDQVIVALQTSDIFNATYITAFDIGGKSILNSTKVADVMFEGLEFI